jgi:hypothetical protein
MPYPSPTEGHLGVPLVERTLARMLELDAVLENLDDDSIIEARAIETALATADSLMTGDIEHPSDVVSHALARWLDQTRNLGLSIDHVRHAA